MNIVLLLNNDIASNLALNLLMPKLLSHNVSVFLSSKVGGQCSLPKTLQELAYFEQHIVYQLLQRNSLNNESQTEKAATFKSYEEIAQYYGIEVALLNEINASSGINKLSELAPDLIISVRYGVILKQQVIDTAKYGVLNLHSGILPAYRGVMATFWALLNGDDKLGTTLHFIDDSSIDTGRVIATSTLTVQTNKSYLWHVLSLYFGGCQLITQAIENIVVDGELETITQPDAGDYYTFPAQAELDLFQEKFGNLFNESEILALLSR